MVVLSVVGDVTEGSAGLEVLIRQCACTRVRKHSYLRIWFGKVDGLFNMKNGLSRENFIESLGT
jgi:aromatic ring-cleaving dioxygenase